MSAGKKTGAVSERPTVENHAVRRLVLAVALIFLGELGIMRFLDFFPNLSSRFSLWADAVLLICLVVPLWFFLFYRPLREKTEECNRERQEVLRQNAFLHTVLDALPYPFYVIDAADYQVKIINRAALGTNERGDLTCHALSHKTTAPCSGGEHPCPMVEVKKTGKPVVVEHLHYNQQGAQRVVEVHGYPIFDENGKVVQMIESSMDITQRKLAEDALRRSEASLQDFLDNANDLIQILDLKGRFLYVNRAWQLALGYTDAELRNLTIHDILHKDSRETSLALFSSSMGRQIVGRELAFVAKDGKIIIVEGNITIQMDEGDPVAVRGMFRDITKRKLLEEQFLEQKHITEKMIKFSAVPIFVLDENHVVTNWNKACEKMTGISAQRVVGTSDHWRAFYPSKRNCLADLVLEGKYDSFPNFYEAFDTSTFLHDGVRSEGWFDNVGGQRRYLVFDAVPIYNRAKKLVAVIETLQDISERKALEEELAQLATTDALTGLYNRHRFNELLEHEVARARRYHIPLSLIMFDLDYFKNINDTYGHAVGDQVLRDVADVIRKNVRSTDWVGRWGGEEFMVLCPEATEKDAVSTAEKLRVLVENHTFETVKTITISCGVTRFKAPDSVDVFVNRADDGLYRAKEKGRNIVEVA